MSERFVPTTLYLTAGLLIWAANFLVTYVWVALVCARGWADVSVIGISVTAAGVLIPTVLAIAATGMVLYRARARYQANGKNKAERDSSRFIDFIAAAGAGVSLIAIVWNAFVAAVPSGCGS
jgi:hypothetical protein